MFRILRVNGRSMLPTLSPDTFVLALKWPKITYQLHDIVVARTPQYGVVIKRVVAAEPEFGFFLGGDNFNESVTPAQIGWVQAKNIIGKVVWQSRSAKTYLT